MADIERLSLALKNAHAAGDTAAAQKLAAALRAATSSAAGSGPAAAAPPSSAPVTPESGGAPPVPDGGGGAPLPGSTLGTVGETIHDATQGLQSGMFFGWDDEVGAAMVTPIETVSRWFQGKGFSPSEAYNEALKFYQAQNEGSRARSPIAYGVGQVAGGVALPGAVATAGLSPLANVAARGAGLGTRVAAAAGEGAIYSGLNAAGDAKENKLEAGLKAAPIGAATGGILERAIGGRQIAKETSKALQSADDMAKDVSGRFKVAKGAHLKEQEFNRMILDSARKAQVVDPNGAVLLDASRVTRAAHPVAHEVRQMLADKLVRTGTGRRVPTLEQTQDIVQDIMKNKLSKANGEDRDMVQAIGERLMKHVDTAPASRFIDPNVGLPARDALKGSYDITRRQKFTKKLEQKAREAANAAILAKGNGKKVNFEALYNVAMRKTLDSSAGKALTAAERADLEKLIIGGPGYLVRGVRQQLQPNWLASVASMVWHPIVGSIGIGLRLSGKAAQRKGRKISERAMNEARRRMSTGVTKKDFLKTIKPYSSPFATAINGQLNDEERR